MSKVTKIVDYCNGVQYSQRRVKTVLLLSGKKYFSTRIDCYGSVEELVNQLQELLVVESSEVSSDDGMLEIVGFVDPTPEELELFNSLEAEFIEQEKAAAKLSKESKEAAELKEYERLKKKYGEKYDFS